MKLLLLTTLVLFSNFSFAKNDPFVYCVGQMGNAIDSVELEIIQDRYNREGVQATLFHMNESTTTYVSEVATKNVIAAYNRKSITLYLRNPQATPKFITITIKGNKGAISDRGLNLFGSLKCTWAE